MKNKKNLLRCQCQCFPCSKSSLGDSMINHWHFPKHPSGTASNQKPYLFRSNSDMAGHSWTWFKNRSPSHGWLRSAFLMQNELIVGAFLSKVHGWYISMISGYKNIGQSLLSVDASQHIMASMNLLPGWRRFTIQYASTLSSHLNIIFWQSALTPHIKIVKFSEPYTICHDHTTFTYFQLFHLKNKQLAATTWNLQNPVQTDMNLNKKITPIPPVKCPVQYPQSRAIVSPTDEATKLASQDAGIWWQLQWAGVRATTPKKLLFEGNQILDFK